MASILQKKLKRKLAQRREEKRIICSVEVAKKNPGWKGGISFEPYCVKFNGAFKDYIRTEFSNECFLCGKTEADNRSKLSVHHVNYNKDCGCDGDLTCQFVPLCRKCHMKTNSNRD